MLGRYWDSVDFELSKRDSEILETLTHRLKLLTIAQLGRFWWSMTHHPEQNAAARVRLMCQAGLLTPITILSHPELELAAPVVFWQPGFPAPDFGAVAYRLRSRWKEPFISTPTVLATTRAARRFGGDAGRHPKEPEQNHEVHLAAVYLHTLRTRPDWARAWISEQRIKRSRPDAPGEKLPDALVDLDGTKTVVEFGGAYPKEKVESFHHFCAYKGYRYELW